MDKISIIIPVYKVEKYLENCIKSVVNQTYKNLEIVLVDDGSPDSCPQICDDWAKKDSRIKVIHKQNEGVSKAVISGINFATGDYLTFLDSDDYVSELFVEKLYNAIIENNADISVCNYTKVFDDKEVRIDEIKKNVVFEKGKNIDNCIYLYSGYEGYYLAPCRWNKMFKRDIVLKSIEFLNTEISMGEDVNMTFYSLSTANKIALITDNLHYYRQISSSLSNAKRNNWVHYEKLLKQMFVMNNSLNLNLECFIYKHFASSFINECMKYAVENYSTKELKQFLGNEYLTECVVNMPKDSIKKKIYYWALKAKNVFMIKLALKFMK